MKVRSVTPEDVPEIVRLSQLCGFWNRSEAGWNWVLFNNPHQGDEPSGYVAEKDGRIVAFLGSEAHALNANGRRLLISNGHTFISDLASPGAAIRLVRHFFKHSTSDAGYTLNNNALSAPIYKKCGLEAIWEERAQTIADKRLRRLTHVISASLRRLANREKIHRFLSRREWFLTQPKAGPVPTKDSIRRLDPFNEGDAALLDGFDAALAASDKIYGVRDAQTVQYRFQDPDGSKDARIFVTEDADGITGLLITRLSKDAAFGVVTLEIEDLIIRPGSGVSVDALVQQAEAAAHHQRAARILWRIIPFDEVMAAAEKRGFALRQLPYDSCHLRPISDWAPLDWQVSGFDGDFWFALRPPPR